MYSARCFFLFFPFVGGCYRIEQLWKAWSHFLCPEIRLQELVAKNLEPETQNIPCNHLFHLIIHLLFDLILHSLPANKQQGYHDTQHSMLSLVFVHFYLCYSSVPSASGFLSSGKRPEKSSATCSQSTGELLKGPREERAQCSS